jgi:hypothetical protein
MEKVMSAYSNVMVTELCASAHDYESAAAFASTHNLSVRSVVSKIKSLGLEYTKKEVVKAVEGKLRKADVVRMIESKLSLKDGALSGLGKADLAALSELLRAV